MSLFKSFGVKSRADVEREGDIEGKVINRPPTGADKHRRSRVDDTGGNTEEEEDIIAL